MKILIMSTMYPNSLRPGTNVVHYFVREWRDMGHEVLVIYYRSMFPRVFTDLARLLPSLAKRYIGNHVEMDRNKNILFEEHEGIPLISVPIFKYIPHGKYPNYEINRQVNWLIDTLAKREYSPDVIIGHFFNPQLEIIGRLKKIYPKAKTCVSLHELYPAKAIKKCYPKNYMSIINGIDIIGFRSVPIKQRFVNEFGNSHKSLICWSGTPKIYLNHPKMGVREFGDGAMTKFLYVGQTIKRKFPKETIEGVHKACKNMNFSLYYIGSKDLGYDETKTYIVKHHLESMVKFIDKIPREEIIKYYDQSECFILISKWEVFGLVYLEAMSRGCIIIAGKGEGMEGIIEHGVNGFLCEPGNAEELTSIICHINSLTAKEKQTISAKAMAKAAELSDYNVANKYLEEVLNS